MGRYSPMAEGVRHQCKYAGAGGQLPNTSGQEARQEGWGGREAMLGCWRPGGWAGDTPLRVIYVEGSVVSVSGGGLVFVGVLLFGEAERAR